MIFDQTPERQAYIAEQQEAALLDGKIASRWGTTEDGGTWIAGNGLLVPELLQPHYDLLEEHDLTTCGHLSDPDDEDPLIFWPSLDERLLCQDCVYGAGGAWRALQQVLDCGLLTLDCERCVEPIRGEFLHLVAPTEAASVEGTFCRGCITAAAPAEVLP